MVQYILNNSLKRSNEVQKFVLDTCKGVPLHLQFADMLATGDGSSVFGVEDFERRLKLGWYLREAGPRWASIQLLALC